MAFQFPTTPFDLQTVENTITGSTYQWRSELTKWVLTRQQTKVSDLIWEGDDEPNPNPGDYKFCLLYTSPSPRDRTRSRMPSSA